MLRKGFLLFAILILIPSFVLSETIDVMIKGIDDGVKTNRQQDYNEAVMNAKLQAIERAGVEIQSITQVVNFQTRFDMVESKAKAVLMPGFQIMDIGYLKDGTYQVVLSGKVQYAEKQKESSQRKKSDLQKKIKIIEHRLNEIQSALKTAKKEYDLNLPWEKKSCENNREIDITSFKIKSLFSTGVENVEWAKKEADIKYHDCIKKIKEEYKMEIAGLNDERLQLKSKLIELKMELATHSN